ncbi:MULTISPECIES: JAB domain-containing protein [Paenibacillus]
MRSLICAHNHPRGVPKPSEEGIMTLNSSC